MRMSASRFSSEIPVSGSHHKALRFRQFRRHAMLATAVAAVAGIAHVGRAANATWTGLTDSLWTHANWSGGTGGTTIAANDVLTFQAAGATGTTLNNDF